MDLKTLKQQCAEQGDYHAPETVSALIAEIERLQLIEEAANAYMIARRDRFCERQAIEDLQAALSLKGDVT